MNKIETDFLIIGAGIIGLMSGKILRDKFPRKKISILEKEPDVAYHASGRNSGVLHAGFYYSSDSLKARFCRDGNLFWRTFCEEKGLKIRKTGKVVVARDESDLESLYELEKRGKDNGVEVYVISEKELREIEPQARTYKYALWSPTTATIDPVEVCKFLKKELIQKDIHFYFNTPYEKKLADNVILGGENIFEAKRIINSAGLYADKIAKDFGYSLNYTILPFKGRYIECSKNRSCREVIRTNIYPVPDLKMPFLGVHWTIKVDGTVKIGPTAFPALWRENYNGFKNFQVNELLDIIKWNVKLFKKDSSNFRSLAAEELKKINKNFILSKAQEMVKKCVDISLCKKWGKPGIRAQLVDKKKLQLEMDFVVEADKNSVHILNAVSPAFTAAYPFCNWVVENYIT